MSVEIMSMLLSGPPPDQGRVSAKKTSSDGERSSFQGLLNDLQMDQAMADERPDDVDDRVENKGLQAQDGDPLLSLWGTLASLWQQPLVAVAESLATSTSAEDFIAESTQGEALQPFSVLTAAGENREIPISFAPVTEQVPGEELVLSELSAFTEQVAEEMMMLHQKDLDVETGIAREPSDAAEIVGNSLPGQVNSFLTIQPSLLREPAPGDREVHQHTVILEASESEALPELQPQKAAKNVLRHFQRTESDHSSEQPTALVSTMETAEKQEQGILLPTGLAEGQKPLWAESVSLPASQSRRASLPLSEQLLGGVQSGITRLMLNRESGEITLRLQLYPESLGKINVVLKVKGDSIAAELKALQPEALVALQAELPELRENLINQGFSEVLLGADISGQADHFAGSRQQQFQEQRREEHRILKTPEVSYPELRLAELSLSRIDRRV